MHMDNGTEFFTEFKQILNDKKIGTNGWANPRRSCRTPLSLNRPKKAIRRGSSSGNFWARREMSAKRWRLMSPGAVSQINPRAQIFKRQRAGVSWGGRSSAMSKARWCQLQESPLSAAGLAYIFPRVPRQLYSWWALQDCAQPSQRDGPRTLGLRTPPKNDRFWKVLASPPS